MVVKKRRTIDILIKQILPDMDFNNWSHISLQTLGIGA